MISKGQLRPAGAMVWEIAASARQGMRVPARVYATEAMLGDIVRDRALDQLMNVATLPGIVNYALAMPDVHEGYGFPVGGVAAFDVRSGIISPGGIGYDINCGVRLLRSGEAVADIRSRLEKLGAALFREVPSGVGKGGRLKLRGEELDHVLNQGAARMVALDYGTRADLEATESGGRLDAADAALVSVNAKDRGHDQLGTMGAGNHFVEVDEVETIFDAAAAERLGLAEGQAAVLIHTGSRGLGHQVATDYIKLMMTGAMKTYAIEVPDRELACAPFDSPEGRRYFAAMSAAANFAWANRQLITWEVRKAWRDTLGSGRDLAVVYDVAHNIAKVEDYPEAHGSRRVVVHRKGATRAFPGQPVLIPGSMGTGSYVLMGNDKSMLQSFGSTCHGAGRRMSRTQAKKLVNGAELKAALNARGIVINAGSHSGLAEEAPQAYRDVDQVVEVVDQAGLARKVARLRPVAVVKG
jgi:tRNA-splicing ligase RtcB (3'-phosphate/5'-hydroxy nucleic acid ligase)